MASTKDTERSVKVLQKLIQSKGITVRRENLSRGNAYKVKSGDCHFSGNKILFVDRRLSPSQQESVLIDYVIDNQITLDEDEFKLLPKVTTDLIKHKSQDLTIQN